MPSLAPNLAETKRQVAAARKRSPLIQAMLVALGLALQMSQNPLPWHSWQWVCLAIVVSSYG